jgi:hypothetical protein
MIPCEEPTLPFVKSRHLKPATVWQGPANKKFTSCCEILGIFLSQSNIITDGGAGGGSYTAGQVTGQGDGKQEANYGDNDHEVNNNHAQSGHGAKFTLGQAAQQLDL